jgi:hypothetical protein
MDAKCLSGKLFQQGVRVPSEGLRPGYLPLGYSEFRTPVKPCISRIHPILLLTPVFSVFII